MDARSKSKDTPTSRLSDNFLSDVVRPRSKHISYSDGFRFGVGLMVAQLFIGLIVGGLAWAIVAAFKLH